DRKGVALLHGWLRRSFAEGKPLNEMARELLASRGSTYVSPEANYYRALRDPYTPAEATAQVFLGTPLQCARRPHHPFHPRKQGASHACPAWCARVDYRVVENNRLDKLDKHEFDGEQIVYQNRDGELPHPRTKEPVPPRFLGADAPVAGGDRLRALADWVAAP